MPEDDSFFGKFPSPYCNMRNRRPERRRPACGRNAKVNGKATYHEPKIFRYEVSSIRPGSADDRQDPMSDDGLGQPGATQHPSNQWQVTAADHGAPSARDDKRHFPLGTSRQSPLGHRQINTKER
jgi:hypothetical protein